MIQQTDEKTREVGGMRKFREKHPTAFNALVAFITSLLVNILIGYITLV